MVGHSQIELRLTRLENDTSAIYELLGDITATQQAHSRRFDSIDQRFETIDQRFDGIDQRFERIDQRFDGIERTLVEIVRRLPEPA